MKSKRVVVGISGGVDSAVSAYLLKSQGYEVIGVFMQNWDSFANQENYDNKKEFCDSHYEYEDAKKVCKHLGIELHKVDFIKEYWQEVFTNFLFEYENARTPNPDVLCNKYIKFGHLLKYSLEHFHCDYIATGHYARVIHFPNRHELHLAKDLNKDQTYFLCDLKQEQLKYALFPLYNLDKNEVRKLAKDIKLPVWDKKDSTGICFIGERNFKDFLKNYIKPRPGNIIDIITNQVLAKHEGIYFYTIGQNKELGLSGQKNKYFVCKKDLEKNILYVVDETNQEQYLYSSSCITEPFNFISRYKDKNQLKVRFRHRQNLIDCNIELLDDNSVKINYPNKAFAVTEGQYAVLYEGTNCLGGAIVKKVLFS